MIKNIHNSQDAKTEKQIKQKFIVMSDIQDNCQHPKTESTSIHNISTIHSLVATFSTT
jgi:hypothetical protein